MALFKDEKQEEEDHWRLHPIGEMLANSFIHLDPVFLENGGISTALGYYKVVKHLLTDAVALVYGEDPDDLTGREWYSGSRELIPAFPRKTIPVTAYQHGPPLNDWVTDIGLDQRERIKFMMSFTNLYHHMHDHRQPEEVEGEFYENSFVTYAIYPLWKAKDNGGKLVRSGDKKSGADYSNKPAAFEVWFYLDLDGKTERVRANRHNPHGSFRRWATTDGMWLKRFETAAECHKFIHEDFLRRCNRFIADEEVESWQDPDFIHAYRMWFRNNLKRERIKRGEESLMEPLGIILQLAIKSFNIAEVIPDIIMTVIQKTLEVLLLKEKEKKTIIEEMTDSKKILHPKRAPLDGAQAEKWRYLNDEESGARRGRTKVYDSIKDTWQVPELLSGVHRRQHCVVTHMGGGIVSVHEANGLKIYYDTGKRECYVLYSGNFKFYPEGTKAEDLQPLSERLRQFFEEGKIVRLHHAPRREAAPALHTDGKHFKPHQTMTRDPIRTEFMLVEDVYRTLAEHCGRNGQDLMNDDQPSYPLFTRQPSLPYILAQEPPMIATWTKGPDGKLVREWADTPKRSKKRRLDGTAEMLAAQ